MLDIGVGGGRTTSHFGPASGSYVGVDYSGEMVAASRQRFRGIEDYRFETADVRDLSRFDDGTFGFVLFSFNGLDDVPADDRGQALAEIRRVARQGGWFCFSSHNLQALDQRHLGVRRQLSRNPRRLARNLYKWLRLRLIHNRHLYGNRLARRSATTVVDYNHGQFMRTYYSRPGEQMAQLTQAGFGEPQVFALDGSELEVPRDLSITDHWLYYLCRVR